MAANTRSVSVVYKFVDGAHFFTSTDPLARGLCVASSDLKTAYDDVPAQLSVLLKVNHGIEDANAEYGVPYENFFAEIMTHLESAITSRHRMGGRPRTGATPRTSALRLMVPEMLAA